MEQTVYGCGFFGDSMEFYFDTVMKYTVTVQDIFRNSTG